MKWCLLILLFLVGCQPPQYEMGDEVVFTQTINDFGDTKSYYGNVVKIRYDVSDSRYEYSLVVLDSKYVRETDSYIPVMRTMEEIPESQLSLNNEMDFDEQ